MNVDGSNLYTPLVSESEWKKKYPEVDREYIWTYPLIYNPNLFHPKQIFEKSLIPQISKDLVIYIHLPACFFRCPMCPFYVEVIKSREDISEYASKVVREFKYYYNSGLLRQYSLKAIYFGGGTASLFKPQDINLIVKTITNLLHISMDTVEITVEGHPATVDYNYLSELYEYGVNRVSFGIQSFDDNTLQKLGLQQSSAQNRKVLNDALNIGFKTVSADMLYRTPEQDLKKCVEQLKIFYDTGIQSLSVYSLELSVREGSLQKEQPDEKTDREMFYAINQMMNEAGWFHTAQPDYSKKQNISNETIVTWRAPQGHTLGLGAGACSAINSSTYFNVHDIKEYYRLIDQGYFPILTGQKFSMEDAMSRYMVLGVRSFVLPREPFRKAFGIDMVEYFEKEIKNLTDIGLIEVEDSEVRVSNQGKYYVDNISKEFYSKENKCHLQPWGEKMKGAVAKSYMNVNDIVEGAFL
ncbi:coproporphyrinogen III oxidase family protein [Lachnospiraceae bacterium MD335]|nr:coproporphyrinogen III oxidase family protein [Lachnospiraceae bacterium MD335]